MEPKTITTALAAKAQRLVDEGAVRHVKGLVYEVQGDHDHYTVVLGYPQEVSGRCTCPSTAAVCSHILAACIDWNADRELLLEQIGVHLNPVQVSGVE